MTITQQDIEEMGTTIQPVGHTNCRHVLANSELKAGTCILCDRDVCLKCVSAHTTLGHEVEENG